MKSRFGMRGAGLLALVAVAVFAGSRAWAQEGKLPTAEEVINKSIEALGGQAEFAKIHNRVMKGTLEVAGQSDKVSLTIYEAKPNKQYSMMDVPGTGKVESGSDGDVCWQVTPMGPLVQEGEQRALALRQATFNDLLHWKQLYQKVECVALETINEHPCYKVVMTPAEGQGEPETVYYDSKTYMPVKSVLTLKGPMGEVTRESVSSDFRKVDGILLPTKLAQTQKIGQMSQTVSVTFDSIEQNVEIPADRFALPEAVKALLAKPKTDTPAATRPATASVPSPTE